MPVLRPIRRPRLPQARLGSRLLRPLVIPTGPPIWVWKGTSTASTTTAVIPYPASGVLAGDIPILVVVSKASSGSGEPPAIADPTGFTKLFEAWGGTGTAGTDTGPVKLSVWRKTTDADGSENGTSVSVVNPASSSMVYGNIHGFQRVTPGSTVVTAFASGSDVTADTTWSVTCGSDPGIQANDLLLWLAGGSVSPTSTFSVEAITATGCTFGTMTEQEDASTSSGFGARRIVATMACTAGTSSAAPVLTATTASASQTGVGAVLRIREQVGGATQVTLNDSGAATDSFTVTVAAPLSDSGTAADSLTITAAVPLGDSGAATDSLAVSIPVGLNDSGIGSDSLTVTAAVPLAEVGAGSDTFAVAAQIPLADTGTGIDSINVGIPKPLSDTGAAADSLTVSAAVLLAEAGTAADTLTVTAQISLNDSGAGSDSISVAQGVQQILLFDSGSATDSIAVAVQTPLADQGTTADGLAVTAAVPLSDVGAAADSVTVGQPKILTDTGTAADSFTVTAQVPLVDLATAADSIAATVLVSLADIGVGVDTFTAVTQIPFTIGALTATDMTTAALATDAAVAASTATDAAGQLTATATTTASLTVTSQAGGPS